MKMQHKNKYTTETLNMRVAQLVKYSPHYD
jgi:hypothetical protein